MSGSARKIGCSGFHSQKPEHGTPAQPRCAILPPCRENDLPGVYHFLNAKNVNRLVEDHNSPAGLRRLVAPRQGAPSFQDFGISSAKECAVGGDYDLDRWDGIGFSLRRFSSKQVTDSNGRGGGIRTPDPLLPKQMRYQTALRPDDVPIVSRSGVNGCFPSEGFQPRWYSYRCTRKRMNQIASTTGSAKTIARIPAHTSRNTQSRQVRRAAPCTWAWSSR
jgi:hypothetical protein